MLEFLSDIRLVCVRIEESLEAKIGKTLELRADTNVIEKGLGANDIRPLA